MVSQIKNRLWFLLQCSACHIHPRLNDVAFYVFYFYRDFLVLSFDPQMCFPISQFGSPFTPPILIVNEQKQDFNLQRPRKNPGDCWSNEPWRLSHGSPGKEAHGGGIDPGVFQRCSQGRLHPWLIQVFAILQTWLATSVPFKYSVGSCHLGFSFRTFHSPFL